MESVCGILRCYGMPEQITIVNLYENNRFTVRVDGRLTLSDWFQIVTEFDMGVNVNVNTNIDLYGT